MDKLCEFCRGTGKQTCEECNGTGERSLYSELTSSIHFISSKVRV